ncbi:hypothetical protein VPH35_140974 [Triticum aestivum]
MGSIKRNYSGWAVLPVVAGILLLAAAGLTACLYRCWFGRTPLHLDLAECAANCKTHPRDLSGKYYACMVMCQSGPDAANDKILHINDGKKEEKKLQEDVEAQLRTSACDECGNTTEIMEYMSCLIRNNCD